MEKKISIMLVIVLLCLSLCGCDYSQKREAPGTDDVTLKVVGQWEDFQALEAIMESFHKDYPNVTMEYEYLQDYSESLETRLASSTDTIDLFVSMGIQEGSVGETSALELFSQSDQLDLSKTFPGLVDNFVYRTQDTSAPKKIYSIPLGAEVRGMYVNKTLLNSLQIEVPQNRAELLDACAKLKEAGYIPMQNNPSPFAQQLMYPYICSLIVNSEDYDATYKKINERQAGIGEMFRDPMQFTYELMEKGYYDYKYVEVEYNRFTDASSVAIARDFLNIVADGEEFTKKDDIGEVAFMPSIMSLQDTLAQVAEDYHSNIEYEFILSPVSDEGGYAYLSPAEGLSINKNSENLDWALLFMDYFYQPKHNKEFAKIHHLVPNTSDACEYIAKEFGIKETQVSHLGQVTFDYEFYAIIRDSLIEISKGNNPKYMQDDGSNNLSLYPFEYYMDNLENGLAEQ